MEKLIGEILKGDQGSLEKLIKLIQKDIFNITLRFLSTREDAEDATQEILVKIITNLGKFEGKSKFTTWAYRVAVNHLLNISKSQLEQHLNFSTFGEDILKGLQSPAYNLPDSNILAEEVKIGCTLAMLTCLNRNLRIAYILGEIYELNSKEAAQILSITPESFRKRLSAARNHLQNFMRSYCGLVNKGNACRCNKRISYAIAVGKVNKTDLKFVTKDELLKTKAEIEMLHTASGVFKSHPSFSSGSQSNEITNIIGNLKNLLNNST